MKITSQNVSALGVESPRTGITCFIGYGKRLPSGEPKVSQLSHKKMQSSKTDIIYFINSILK